MDLTLFEAVKNDDDSDLEAKLKLLSRYVLDELLLVVLQQQSVNFAEKIVLAKVNLPNDIIQINIMEIPMEKHEVNSSPTNEKEVLALELDIHPLNNTEVHDDTADRRLIPNNIADQGIDVSKVALLIGFFTLISGSTISALSNLKDSRKTETNKAELTLVFKDILLHPDKLPDAFYNILLLKIAFTMSIVLVVASLWPIIKDRSFCYWTILFAGVATFFFRFGYILKDKVPKFWLTAIDSFSIPSFWLV
ncbi:hypothetical protein LOK49_LG01G01610 [Camellia lanceoleosa]|uniref:Uncharacterized protein n=1 Tax=Camellia lanceoleosa TaxID=1840588 RepID=A0ACC0J5X0_9ERIC|nr:hypothetical protein LOK49_LG01G01610 [Camellia lanceoleosa]